MCGMRAVCIHAGLGDRDLQLLRVNFPMLPLFWRGIGAAKEGEAEGRTWGHRAPDRRDGETTGSATTLSVGSEASLLLLLLYYYNYFRSQ